MAANLDLAAAALAEAVTTMERTLAGTRGEWDDAARRAFDQQHAIQILGDAKQMLAELRQLAADLGAAMRLLSDSG